MSQISLLKEKIEASISGHNVILYDVKWVQEGKMRILQVSIMNEDGSMDIDTCAEMSSLIGDFREKFITALQDEKIFANMGIKISVLTVDGFHANEEDLELIRNRINAWGD